MSGQSTDRRAPAALGGLAARLGGVWQRVCAFARIQAKKRWVIASAVALLAALGLWISLSGMGGVELFSAESELAFDSISCVARSGDTLAVVDSSGERLYIIESDHGSLYARKMFYTGDGFTTLTGVVVTDAGEVFASNVDYGEDGVTVVAEQIKRFGKDGSVSVISAYDYDPADECAAGMIIDMWAQGSGLGYLYFGEEPEICSVAPDKERESVSPFAVDEEWMADAYGFRSAGEGCVFVNTGSGDIYRVDTLLGTSERIYSAAQFLTDTGANSFPFCIDVAADGSVYYLDAADKTVKRLTGAWQTDEALAVYGDTVGAPCTVLSKTVIGAEQPDYEGWSGYYTLSVSDDNASLLTSCSNLLIALDLDRTNAVVSGSDLAPVSLSDAGGASGAEVTGTDSAASATDVSAIRNVDAGGKRSIEQASVRLSPEYPVRRVASWFFGAVLLAALCYLAGYLLFTAHVFSLLTPLAKQILLMVAGIAVCSVAACLYISNVYVGTLEQNLSGAIENAASIAALSYDGDEVEYFSDVSTYGSPEYNAAYERAAAQFDSVEANWSTGLYIGFLFERERSLNVLFYSDSSYSPYIPLGFETDSQFYAPYQQAKDTGRAVVDEIVDYSGKYLYALAPLTDSQGEVSSFIELGTFAGVFREKLERFAFDTVVTVIGLVAVLLFLFVEISFAIEVFSKGKRGVKARAVLKWPRSVVRIPSFLSYFVANITLYLMPIIMLDLVGDGMWGISPEAAAALPLTFTMAGILIASIISPVYMRLGWKTVTVSCFALTAACFCVLAFSLSPLWFIIIALLIGFANGANYMGMYEFICASSETDGGESTELISAMNAGMFAGASCGVVVGTFLYGSFGSLVTFLAAGVLSLLSGVFVYLLLPAIRRGNRQDGGRPTGALRFIFSRSTLLYGLLIIIPVTVTTFFVLHFVPLYFEEQGLSSGLSSLVYLLNGMMITFLGPSITKAITHRVGLRTAAVLSAVLAGGALIIYSIVPVISAAVIIALLLGLTEAFGQSTRIDYFSGTPEALRYGKTEAAGIYNALEGVAQLVGPSIFSYILVLGVSGGMLLLGGAALLLGLLYLIICRSRGTGSGTRS